LKRFVGYAKLLPEVEWEENMAIAPKCDVIECGQELREFGALLFSAPDANGLTKK